MCNIACRFCQCLNCQASLEQSFLKAREIKAFSCLILIFNLLPQTENCKVHLVKSPKQKNMQCSSLTDHCPAAHLVKDDLLKKYADSCQNNPHRHGCGHFWSMRRGGALSGCGDCSSSC